MKDPSALHVFPLTYTQNKYQKPLKIIFNWQSEFRYVVNKKRKVTDLYVSNAVMKFYSK